MSKAAASPAQARKGENIIAQVPVSLVRDHVLLFA